MDTKQCSACKAEKPATTEFWYRRASSPDGLSGRCKVCADASTQAARAKQPDLYRQKKSDYQRLVKLGVTADEYDQMWRDQAGKCAICEVEFETLSKAPACDHCHETGKVRGLLCDPCNVGLGFFSDDPKRLAAAISYLS